MSMTDKIFTVIFIISALIFAIITIMSVISIIQIYNTFRCKNCGKFNSVIYKGCYCSKCKRKWQSISKEWYWILIRKMSIINLRRQKIKYSFKDYIKPFILEFIISTICTVILSLNVVNMIIN